MAAGGDDALVAVGAYLYRVDSLGQAHVRWQADGLHLVVDKNSADGHVQLHLKWVYGNRTPTDAFNAYCHQTFKLLVRLQLSAATAASYAPPNMTVLATLAQPAKRSQSH